jgi:antitoxin component of MazEF toxin-antitoxin module
MVVVTKKIVTIGGSRGIIFDKELMEKLDLDLGDYVEVKIGKIIFKEDKEKAV